MNFWNMDSNMWETIQKINITQADNWGPQSMGTHTLDTQKQSTVIDRTLLITGEVTSGEVTTDGFTSTSRIDGCTWLAWRLVGVGSTAAMADDEAAL